MANVEINDLTAKTTPDETDELEIQETAGGTSKKITRANFIPDASTTVKGKVELATTGETTTGTDTERATTPAGVKAVADTKANTSHTHAAADVTSGLLANARIATGTPDGTKFLRDDQSWQAIPGGGDALTTNPLSQFAATTSAQLAGVLSDETGTGAAVFADSPALITPTGIVKGDVGLGNVDNTSDANKPVSTATQTALDAKVDENSSITGATKTKITYDAKGLVTAGADATQDDIGDGTTNKQYPATDKTKLAGIETAADVTDATNVDAAGATMNTDSSLAGNSYFLDEDNMSSNSDTKVPSQQSVKAYVDTAVTGLLDFKGSTDASSNPNYPSALKGDAYVISVAGKVGGASGKSVDVGDVYLATADNAGGTEASVGTSWTVLEHNLVGAYVAGGTDVAVADGGTGSSTAAGAATNLGLGTGDSPQFTGIELGHATDTTITRPSAGDINIEGNRVYRAGGTDVAIADGGTGASTAAAGFDALSPMTTAGDIIYGGASGTRTRLGIGTALQVLRTNAGATAPEWATVAAGGQTVVTRIVAASGGDHTTLGAAITAASSGDTILVRKGTFTESAITSSTTNLTIIGENPNTSIISMGSNALTLSGTGLTLKNVMISSGSGLQTYSGTHFKAYGCIFKTTSDNQNAFQFSGTNAKCSLNDFYLNNATANRVFRWNSDRSYCNNNYFYFASASSSATFGNVDINGTGMEFNGNIFQDNDLGVSNAHVTMGVNAFTSSSFCGNTMYMGTAGVPWRVADSAISCNISNNTAYLCKGKSFQIEGNNHTINGNILYSTSNTSSEYGIYITSGSGDHVITGNRITGGGTTSTAGIYIAGSSAHRCIISGNRIGNYATGVHIVANVTNTQVTSNELVGNTTAINDLGTSSYLRNNSGATALMEKEVVYMKNTSGATINAGNVVVIKAAAGGDEITTTTSAGDNKVYGVATAAITNNSYGYIQTLGKTTILTVNGTTDIAIGDYLSCYTSAGIAQKASAGHMVFAMALEAYTADDSSGVIDALILSPRLI